jgi:cytochrome c biogenesis factor
MQAMAGAESAAAVLDRRIHPPMLYQAMGFSSLYVRDGVAVKAAGRGWINTTRRWTLVT